MTSMKPLARIRFFVALLLAIFSVAGASPSYAQDASPPKAVPSETPDRAWYERWLDPQNNHDFATRKRGAQILLEGYGCGTCEIFEKFSSAVFSVSGKVDAAGKSLIAPMVSFASLFGLFYLGSAFVTGDASDLLGRWQVFWRLCMAVAGGAAFLSAPLTLAWDYIYWPLFSIGDGLVSIVGGVDASCGGLSVGGAPKGANMALNSMGQTVCGSYEMVMDGLANGIAFMTHKDGIMNTLIYALFGFLIVMIYGYLAVIFPLKFIDVVLKLAIIGFITPILGICAVFKPTRGYVGIAISNVLNAAAQFALLTIIFKIGDQVFTEMVQSLGIGAVKGDEQDMMDAFITGLVMFGVAFIFVGLVNSVPSIAAEITRYSGSSGGEGAKAAAAVIGRPAAAAASTAGATSRAAGNYAMTKRAFTKGLEKGIPKPDAPPEG